VTVVCLTLSWCADYAPPLRLPQTLANLIYSGVNLVYPMLLLPCFASCIVFVQRCAPCVASGQAWARPSSLYHQGGQGGEASIYGHLVSHTAIQYCFALDCVLTITGVQMTRLEGATCTVLPSEVCCSPQETVLCPYVLSLAYCVLRTHLH
jgi:hypothetical protein